jgi:N-acetylmuramoyl-L-alanine amidase
VPDVQGPRGRRFTGADASRNLLENRKDDTLSSRHLALLATVLACGILMVTGCSHRRGIPHTPDEVPGYHKAPPDLAGIDPSALTGRRILVDPGHGGRFPGAIGDEGLTEAEVNLGVALYLQGLLQWAGADVHLTRTADVDFLSPADSSLTADLAARVAICDSLQPDVFLSIHHNSTASRDPLINETQTYYPIGREGADRDLALAIHRQLVRALAISPARILPGGFHVLRNAPVPAVLGEPAMISNPVIEGRLTLARSLELEARAYFLGLLDYFAAGTPQWVTDLPDTLRNTRRDLLVWRFDPGRPGAPGLDPATVRLTLDGEPIAHRLTPDDQGVVVEVRHLRGGRDLSVSGRNLAGRATPVMQHLCQLIDRGPWRSVFIAEPGQPPYTGLLHYDVGAALTGLGPIALASPDRPTDGIPLPVFPGAEGWSFMDPAPADLPQRLLVEHQRPDVAGRYAGSEPTIHQLPEGSSWRLLATPEAIWPGSVVPGGHWRQRHPDRPLGYGDTDWPALVITGGQPHWLEADGALPILLAPDGRTPWQAPDTAPLDTLVWRPLLPALVGRRVAIDPRGGGVDEQTRGPYGATGSELNLQIARRLGALLRGVGCEVALVRDDELHTPEPAKVARADRFDADLYLALGRGTPAVSHHPGSVLGEPWARASAAALAPLLADTVAAQPAYDYVLRHTACPAIVVFLEAVAEAATEERLRSPAWQDAVARALLRGLVDLLEPGTPQLDPAGIVASLGAGAIPVARLDHARLDGNLGWLPPSGLGRTSPVASWAAGDPGWPALGDRHVLALHAGPHWQVWTLTRQPTGDWHGRVFLENR